MTRVSSTEWPTNHPWSVPFGSDNKLVLSQMVEWKFRNLNKAFEQAVTQMLRSLLLYSDVVHSIIVGDASHLLVREVYYRHSGVDTVYFEPLHIQWLPLRCPYLDVIEVSLAESSGHLVAFGKGKTIIAFQFRRCGAHACTQIQSINMRGGSLTPHYPPAARDQDGDGFTEELIKIAGPAVLEYLQSGLCTTSSGKSLGVVGEVSKQTLKRGVKWKAGMLIKAGVKAGGQHDSKNAKRKVSDILVEHEHIRGSIASTSSRGIESVLDVRFQYKWHRPSTSGRWLRVVSHPPEYALVPFLTRRLQRRRKKKR